MNTYDPLCFSDHAVCWLGVGRLRFGSALSPPKKCPAVMRPIPHTLQCLKAVLAELVHPAPRRILMESRRRGPRRFGRRSALTRETSPSSARSCRSDFDFQGLRRCDVQGSEFGQLGFKFRFLGWDLCVCVCVGGWVGGWVGFPHMCKGVRGAPTPLTLCNLKTSTVLFMSCNLSPNPLKPVASLCSLFLVLLELCLIDFLIQCRPFPRS